MEWKQLLSVQRWGNEDPMFATDPVADRSQFQRDYDRIIFSSPFRRLQNKTQVFPLPGSIFVHNRLTHSLEVASVGRSLGNIFYNNLKFQQPDIDASVPLMAEIGNCIAAACLAHDMGNPAFGHSGEAAISHYFTDAAGLQYKDQLYADQWNDLIHFEGNANALRTLIHPYIGKGYGGFALTYSTLAAIIKYPCASAAGHQKKIIHQKKYGFFHSEQESFLKIANALGMQKAQDEPLVYKRHPLVFLVEAADDICYSIIDLEDAHRLKILSYEKVEELLIPFCEENKIRARLEKITDDDAKVSLLRAKSINTLIGLCSSIFLNEQQSILTGDFNNSLTALVPSPYKEAWDAIAAISIDKIYNHPQVIQIEVAGYKVIGGLLEEFIPALIQNKSNYHKKLVALIPKQFIQEQMNVYAKIQSVLDFVSGMTDLYAVELYRKIKGISFPTIA